MKHLPKILFFIFLLFCKFASAEIFKHVDPDGRIHYSNIKTEGSKKLNTWSPVVENENFIYFTDTYSLDFLDMHKSIIGINVITDNKTQQKTYLGTDYLSVESRLEFDCKQSLYKVKSAYFYVENELKGKNILAIKGNLNAEWYPIQPKSILEELKTFNCNYAFGILKK